MLYLYAQLEFAMIAESYLDIIKNEGIEFVELCSADMRGVEHQASLPARAIASARGGVAQSGLVSRESSGVRSGEPAGTFIARHLSSQ